MTFSIIFAHGEGLITTLVIAFLGSVCALGCLVGAIMHYFSKDPSDKRDALFFLAAAGVCVLLVLLSPAIARLFGTS